LNFIFQVALHLPSSGGRLSAGAIVRKVPLFPEGQDRPRRQVHPTPCLVSTSIYIYIYIRQVIPVRNWSHSRHLGRKSSNFLWNEIVALEMITPFGKFPSFQKAKIVRDGHIYVYIYISNIYIYIYIYIFIYLYIYIYQRYFIIYIYIYIYIYICVYIYKYCLMAHELMAGRRSRRGTDSCRSRTPPTSPRPSAKCRSFFLITLKPRVQ